VPELSKLVSFGKTAFLSGQSGFLSRARNLVCRYHSAAPCVRPLLFSVSFIAISFILAWLRVKSEASGPAVSFQHASHIFSSRIYSTG